MLLAESFSLIETLKRKLIESDSEEVQSSIRIGVAITKKKLKWFEPIMEAFKLHPELSTVIIDKRKPFAAQGPFDVVIHKLTGRTSKQLLREYLEANPHVTALDSLDAIKSVDDRWVLASRMKDFLVESSTITIRHPTTALVREGDETTEVIREAGLRFPLIYKPIEGEDHKVAMVYNEEGLIGLKPPYVLQQYTNHDGILYKYYILGNYFSLILRPSLPNLTEEDLSTAPDIDWFGRISNANETTKKIDLTKVVDPTYVDGQHLQLAITQVLGLSMFGADLIRDSETGIFYLIDLNYFPGYYGIPDLGEKVIDAVKYMHHPSKPTKLAKATTLSSQEVTVVS